MKTKLMLNVLSVFTVSVAMLPALASADVCGGAGPNEHCIADSAASDGSEPDKPIFVKVDGAGNLIGMRVGSGPNSEFTVAQLRSKSGADLMIHNHSGILKLSLMKFNALKGAKLDITYDPDIINPFQGKRHLDLIVKRDNDGVWRLYDSNKKPITRLVLQPAARGIAAISPIAILRALEPARNSGDAAVEGDLELAKNDLTPVAASDDDVDAQRNTDATRTAIF